MGHFPRTNSWKAQLLFDLLIVKDYDLIFYRLYFAGDFYYDYSSLWEARPLGSGRIGHGLMQLGNGRLY